MDIQALKEIVCKTICIDQSDLSGNGNIKSQTHIVYARMLFSHYAFLHSGNKHLISKELNMSISSVNYYLTRYSDEIEFSNKVFESLDKQVNICIHAN